MITPGAYLKARRNSAGLSLDDVARSFDTDPAQPVFDRAAWIKSMEGDIAPISLQTLAILATVVPIDIAIMWELEQNRLGLRDATTPLCVFCGTTDRATCALTTAPFCAWTARPEPVEHAA